MICCVQQQEVKQGQFSVLNDLGVVIEIKPEDI